MGFYVDHILPRVINGLCDMKAAREQRARVCEGLAGEVVEIGFGSGLNAPFYPPAVTGVAAVEPADVAWKLAAQRVRAAGAPVRRAGLDGQSLPFEDDSFDAALSTWTMCTIPDLPAALAELRRVLRPGGALHFVEHGLAPDAKVQRWQHRLNPIQNRLFGGCNLNRPTVDLLRGAGFEIEHVDVGDREARARDELRDPAGQVATAEQALLHRFEAMLPALHRVIGGQPVLDEVQRAAGLEHPAHFGQRRGHIRNGAHRPGRQGRVATRVRQR